MVSSERKIECAKCGAEMILEVDEPDRKVYVCSRRPICKYIRGELNVGFGKCGNTKP